MGGDRGGDCGLLRRKECEVGVTGPSRSHPSEPAARSLLEDTPFLSVSLLRKCKGSRGLAGLRRASAASGASWLLVTRSLGLSERPRVATSQRMRDCKLSRWLPPGTLTARRGFSSVLTWGRGTDPWAWTTEGDLRDEGFNAGSVPITWGTPEMSIKLVFLEAHLVGSEGENLQPPSSDSLVNACAPRGLWPGSSERDTVGRLRVRSPPRSFPSSQRSPKLQGSPE